MNNLFSFATKELSQDAMFCWLVNWLNYPESQLYSLGVAAMNLFLGERQLPSYYNVEVFRQFKKIDVLILFNDSYALILEDKTNTSEHGDQIKRYTQALEKEESPKFKNREIITSYVKTGIMYDADGKMAEKVDAVVSLEGLLLTLKPFAEKSLSPILNDYAAYLQELADERQKIDYQIVSGQYSTAFSTHYGQFSFLNKVFCNRSKGTSIGNEYAEGAKNSEIYIDSIYAGTNNGGEPWTQYCFWGRQYPTKSADKNEYHYLFWRIDKFRKGTENGEFYIALRHYDENAHSKSAANNERKRKVYEKLRKAADELGDPHGAAKKIGQRANYKESDLIFIPANRLAQIGCFEEVQQYLADITAEMKLAADGMGG